MTVIWNRWLIKRPAPWNIRKAGMKRSTDGPPSERITRRLRGDFGMDIWKVASEPEW